MGGFVGPRRTIPFVLGLKCMGGENPEFIQKVSNIPSPEVIGERGGVATIDLVDQ